MAEHRLRCFEGDGCGAEAAFGAPRITAGMPLLVRARPTAARTRRATELQFQSSISLFEFRPYRIDRSVGKLFSFPRLAAKNTRPVQAARTIREHGKSRGRVSSRTSHATRRARARGRVTTDVA